MKTTGLKLIMTGVAVATLWIGCAASTGTLSEKPDAGAKALEDPKVETGSLRLHPNGHFASVADFFQWVNAGRQQYAFHRRSCGNPNDLAAKVKAVGKPVFPVTFIWDDGLALRAQQEADRLSRGGIPRGVQFTNQAYDPVKAWGDGYFTKDWMLTAFEEVGDWERFPLGFANGRARMGLWYQDFFENGPVITRLGIGAAVVQNGIWWVLQFGV